MPPRRRQDIPAARLRELNRGRAETRDLVEWLAIDDVALLRAVLPGEHALHERAESLRSQGVMRRVVGIGRAVAERFGPDHGLSAHPSDMVRCWVAWSDIAAAPRSGLAARLRAARPYAADRHFGVRELAAFSARHAFLGEIRPALALLQHWTAEKDPNLRRFASESTRPRGVWAPHIPELKADPSLAGDLLEALRADPSPYVRDSLGNWLNDAGKSRPDWVRRLCARWREESPCPETGHVLRRALRNLGDG